MAHFTIINCRNLTINNYNAEETSTTVQILQQLPGSHLIQEAPTPSGQLEHLSIDSAGAPDEMNWQDYVDKQLLASKCVTKACIAGLDGTTWAKSDGFEVAQSEIQTLVTGFANQQIFQGNGVTLAGQRYIYLSGTDRVVRAKQGKVGVHCMKTQQAVVISLYEDPILHQQAASVVEKLGDYLVSCGY